MFTSPCDLAISLSDVAGLARRPLTVKSCWVTSILFSAVLKTTFMLCDEHRPPERRCKLPGSESKLDRFTNGKIIAATYKNVVEKVQFKLEKVQ